LGEDAEIKAGSTGQFDVIANGTLIFSKATAHRFPIDGEVEERFEALRDGRELEPLEPAAPTGFISRMLGRLRN
jgi:Rdx family